ncbi:hypothetical protein C8R45DRAFT_941050 [Mycena sanguinolenta]|nr:hypothetical protein C8R45DRAFT_941050 [Mycena sanguinolenta]
MDLGAASQAQAIGVRKMASQNGLRTNWLAQNGLWDGVDNDVGTPYDQSKHCGVVDPEQSFAETNSQTTFPVRCHGCGVNKPDGDDIYEEVQCKKCKNWSHIEYLLVGVDWHAEDVRFICQFCRDEDPLGSFGKADILLSCLWPGRVVMVPDPSAPDWMAPDVKWYPARFIKYKGAAPQRKYEFEWFECTDSFAYHSDNYLMPPELLRKFTRGRSFCEEVEDIDLTAEQLGKVRLPFYLRPDYPKHKNLELTAIFTAATTPITKILAAFNITHPGVADLMQYFRGKKLAERRRGLNYWLARLQLVPTPELEEVLARVASFVAASHHSLRNDGHMALNEMFAATHLPDVKTGELTRELLAFRNAHAIYDPDFRPPIYFREAPSMASPTKPVLVVLKRKAGTEAEVDGEKEPKRRKTSKLAKKDDPLTSELNKDAPKRRLRSTGAKAKIIGGLSCILGVVIPKVSSQIICARPFSPLRVHLARPWVKMQAQIRRERWIERCAVPTWMFLIQLLFPIERIAGTAHAITLAESGVFESLSLRFRRSSCSGRTRTQTRLKDARLFGVPLSMRQSSNLANITPKIL